MEAFSQVIRKNKKSYQTLSPLERKVVDLLLKYDGLDFESNYKVGPYFVDIAFPKHKVALEIDGHAFHSSEAQIAKDGLREEYLREVEGWKIERVAGWFCFRHPDIAIGKVLRHVPEVKDHPLFLDACHQAKQFYARDLLNRGFKKEAVRVLGGEI